MAIVFKFDEKLQEQLRIFDVREKLTEKYVANCKAVKGTWQERNKALQELRKEYNNLLHTNKPLAEDLLGKLDNIEKSLKNLHMNYILSFGKYAFRKDLFNWDIEDKYKEKLLAAIWVEDRNIDDWEKLSEEQKNAFAQYSKKEKLEHKKNLNEILHNLIKAFNSSIASFTSLVLLS